MTASFLFISYLFQGCNALLHSCCFFQISNIVNRKAIALLFKLMILSYVCFCTLLSLDSMCLICLQNILDLKKDNKVTNPHCLQDYTFNCILHVPFQ